MSEFAKMDIFFFITTIVAVVLGILFVMLMVYFIRIAKDIKYISQKAKTEAGLISEDLSDLRENIKDKGAKLKYFLSFFKNLGREKKSQK